MRKLSSKQKKHNFSSKIEKVLQDNTLNSELDYPLVSSFAEYDSKKFTQ